jgi:hypothetical protein
MPMPVWYVPVSQRVHRFGEFMPSDVEYVPEGHELHRAIPVPDEYSPAPHRLHADNPVPDWYEPDVQRAQVVARPIPDE